MKTVDEIISQKAVYLNDFTSRVEVLGNFFEVYISDDEYNAEKSPYANEEYWLENKNKMNQLLKEMADVNILFASYGNENYSGDAYVLFERNGELFEVSGSHCSCYGLENQWDEEKVMLEELENRLVNGTFGEDDYSGNEFKKELCDFLGVEYKQNRKKYY